MTKEANTETLHPFGHPSIIEMASERGFLETLTPLLNRVYLRNEHLTDKVLIESLLCVALYNCNGRYCYIVHASSLLGKGVSQREIRNLTELLQLPEFVENRLKWNNVLKLTFFLFKGGCVTSEIEGVRAILSEEEYQDYTHLIALAYTLRNIMNFYSPELDFVNEIKLLPEHDEIKLELKELVNYFDESKETEAIPVVTMCMYCKDVRNNEGEWFPIEMAIKFLGNETGFSHGVCERCCSLNFGKVHQHGV